MNIIRQYPLSENPNTAWTNKIARAVNSQNIIAGSGIKVAYDPSGTTITLNSSGESAYMDWKGDFDETAEYYPGHVVRVIPNRVYTNGSGINLVFGFTSETGYAPIPISPGLFICVNYVPPNWLTEDKVTSDICPQFYNGVPPDNIIASTRFYTKNVYYPVFPEIPAANVVAAPVFQNKTTVMANMTYWQALPVGMINTKMCVNGSEKDFYATGMIKDSAFLTEYLPYNPPA